MADGFTHGYKSHAKFLCFPLALSGLAHSNTLVTLPCMNLGFLLFSHNRKKKKLLMADPLGKGNRLLQALLGSHTGLKGVSVPSER